jgi:hypothetical protein
MEAVLWVLAVLGNWTVIDRIYYTWKELPKPKVSNSSGPMPSSKTPLTN